MSFTRDQYDKLKEAVALGALTVTHRGKTVTYRSLREMIILLNKMEVGLNLRTRKGALGGTRSTNPAIITNR